MRVSDWSSDVRSSDLSALLLPLTLLAAPAFAQTEVKEDSVILQPDKVKDDAPVVAVRIEMLSWTEDNATALLSFIEKVGDEGLFARDYNPEIGRAHV